MNATPMPRLPLVTPSSVVMPGVIKPFSSASSINLQKVSFIHIVVETRDVMYGTFEVKNVFLGRE
uniref:Uncharacterized protein n=1 Tax=Triticum urartu TaxID=4572 RepID=A0A8R7QNK1_TRIUA